MSAENKYAQVLKQVESDPIPTSLASPEDTQEGRRVVGVQVEQQEDASPDETLGVGGTSIYSGYIQELERDPELTGIAKYKTYSDLLANVAIIATGVRFFLNLVSKAVWKLEPAKARGEDEASDEAEELADLTWEIFNDMETPWHRVVRRSAMYKNYGFSIQEWTSKLRPDGNVGFLDIEPRPQITIERWDTDIHSRVLGVVQRSPQTQLEIYLPREKIVYLVDDSLNDSPEGLGLFRHLVDSGRRLRRYLQLEGFGYENDLRGIPLARAPLTDLDQLVKDKKITQERADELIGGMTQFLTKHIKSPQLAMLLDSKTYQTTDERQTPSNVPQWDIELLDGGSYSLEEIHEAITRIITEIARLLGVEHLMLGDGDSGSFALAKEKTQNFFLIVDNTLKEIAEQYEKDLIDPLWEMNGWPEDLKPKLKFEPLAKRDIAELVAAMRDLSMAGIVLDRRDEAVQEIMDQLGLSRLDPGMVDEMFAGIATAAGIPPASDPTGAAADDGEGESAEEEEIPE